MARDAATIPAAALELGPLRHSLGFLLRLAQLDAFAEFYREMDPEGLRPGEFTVLWLIRLNAGLRQGVLAATLRIRPAHMTKLVRRLDEAGLILRRVPEHDRRAVELTLTPAGERLVAANAEAFLGLSGAPAGRLDRAEQQALTRLLQKYAGLEDTP